MHYVRLATGSVGSGGDIQGGVDIILDQVRLATCVGDPCSSVAGRGLLTIAIRGWEMMPIPRHGSMAFFTYPCSMF